MGHDGKALDAERFSESFQILDMTTGRYERIDKTRRS